MMTTMAFANTTVIEERSVSVSLVSVYDGDTVIVDYVGLPAPLNRMRIRLEGIDAPEIGRGARCPLESKLAIESRDYLKSLLITESVLKVYDFKWDKYGGRILGQLRTDRGGVKELMLDAGKAAPYDGVGQRKDWCVNTP